MAVGDNLSGKDGKVNWGASPTEIKITRWNRTKTIATKNVSDSGSSGGMEKIPDGLYDIAGSFDGFLKAGVAKPTVGAVIALELVTDSNIKYAGNGIITSEDTGLQVSGGEAVAVSYSFEGTGAWTDTDTTT